MQRNCKKTVRKTANREIWCCCLSIQTRRSVCAGRQERAVLTGGKRRVRRTCVQTTGLLLQMRNWRDCRLPNPVCRDGRHPLQASRQVLALQGCSCADRESRKGKSSAAAKSPAGRPAWRPAYRPACRMKSIKRAAAASHQAQGSQGQSLRFLLAWSLYALRCSAPSPSRQVRLKSQSVTVPCRPKRCVNRGLSAKRGSARSLGRNRTV